MLLKGSSLGLGAAMVAALPTAAHAQITPDGTLGTEGSTVTEDAIVRGDVADLIEGGTIRGGNLFHSFLEFNIDEGQRVYFANPAGIESILSRITGSDPSNIFGTLGVDGGADLFLINPNGIVFGETAALDIEGSFYASTAEAIELGDGVYSATAPEQSSLLTVNPSALFSSYLTAASGDIENRGQLTAQENLTLAANNLDLQGQVVAGGDLTLLGLGTVQIRDTAAVPFVGFADGDLLVQGNEQVDIVALSHVDSGLYSYGDMVLRSGTSIHGNTYFQSSGSFSSELLDSTPNQLFNTEATLILSGNNAILGGYEGPSLRILAGGGIYSIGSLNITSPGRSLSAGLDFSLDFENLFLSDGYQINLNNETGQILDLRAGINTEVLSQVFKNLDVSEDLNLSNDSASLSHILIDGDINNRGGTVYLSNQYFSESLPDAGIWVLGETNAGHDWNEGDSGQILIDSSGLIYTEEWLSTSAEKGDGGNIRLLAEFGYIFTEGIIFASAWDYGDESFFDGGNVNIFARSGDIHLNGIYTQSNSSGSAGDVSIHSENGDIYLYSWIQADAWRGDGGDVEIIADRGGIIETGGLNSIWAFSSSLSDDEGFGNGGNISLFAGEGNIAIGNLYTGSGTQSGGSVSLEALNGSIQTGSIDTTGDVSAGTIKINSANGNISTRQIDASSITFGEYPSGRGGTVNIQTTAGNVTTQNIDTGSVHFGGSTAGLGGEIYISTENGNILTGILDTSSSSSQGASSNAGSIVLRTIRGDITTKPAYAFSFAGGGGAQNGNTISFSTNLGSIITEYLVSSSISEIGDAQVGGNISILASNDITIASVNTVGQLGSGNIFMKTREGVEFREFDSDPYSNQFVGPDRGVVITSDTFGSGPGGNIQIEADTLSITNGSQISASTHSSGPGGNILLNISNEIVLEGMSPNNRAPGIFFAPGGLSGIPIGTYLGGYIPTGNAQELRSGSLPSNIEYPSGVFTQTTQGATGSAGNITIHSNRITIADGGTLAATTFGFGNAGNLLIGADSAINISGGSILSGVASTAKGESGQIALSGNSLHITNGGLIQAGTYGYGSAGDIYLNFTESVRLNLRDSEGFPSRILSTVGPLATGNGGEIELHANSLDMRDGAHLSVSSSGEGDAGSISISVAETTFLRGSQTGIFSTIEEYAFGRGGDIEISANSLVVRDLARVASSSFGQGDAGNIRIQAIGNIEMHNGTIETVSAQSSGGMIDAIASNIWLFEDSDIQTYVSGGFGSGGNIKLKSQIIYAFDDSDIFAYSADGQGGNIVLDALGFLGENYTPSFSRLNWRLLEGNGRVDINATGGFASGTILTPDTSFIENSLTNLEDTIIDTASLTAGSCIARSEDNSLGAFTVTGSDGLPQRPGNTGISAYPTGTVRTAVEPAAALQEPDGVYQLPDGRLVLSRACD